MSSCSFGKKSKLQSLNDSRGYPSSANSTEENVQYRTNPQGKFTTEFISAGNTAIQHPQYTWAPAQQPSPDQQLDTEGSDEELSRMGGKVANIRRGVAELFHDNLETIQYLDDFTMEIERLSELLEKKNARNLRFENQNNAIRGRVLTTALERDIRRELEENKQRWNQVYQDEELVPDFEHHSWKRPRDGGSSRAASPKQSPKKRTWGKAQNHNSSKNNRAKPQVGENRKVESLVNDKMRNQAINSFDNGKKKNQDTLERKSVEVKQQPNGGSENANTFKVDEPSNSNVSLSLIMNLPSDMTDQPSFDTKEKRVKYSRSTYNPNTTYNRTPRSLRGSSIIKTPKEGDSQFWK